MSTSVDPFHEKVARIALQSAERYGFVLGGGLALILLRVVNRPTEDIDLFGPDTSSVAEAAAAVVAALQRAGIRVTEEDADSDLAAVIDGLDYVMAELVADVARAGRRLDITPDRAFAAYGLGAEEISRLRDRFADWPRGRSHE